MNITNYVKAKSLAEAFDLNQKKSSVILGGCCWLRLSPRRTIGTAIDLVGLGLDKIEETDEEISLGCMVTLRQIETCKALSSLTNDVLKNVLAHIVGVQFRNLATVGGSICGRFGFSDILALFLVLDADVELYQAGRMKLSEFASKGVGRDILTKIILPKKKVKVAYDALRLSITDFPVINCAAAYSDAGIRCAIGARPERAELVATGAELLANGGSDEAIAAYAVQAADSLTFGSNLRGSAEYRKDMAVVLCKRVLHQLAKEGA